MKSPRAAVAAFLALCLVLCGLAPAHAGGVAAEVMVATGDGGPTRLDGSGAYTFFGTQLIYDQPDVVLIDQSGLYVDRNVDFLAARQGQILGRFTSDFSRPPFHYTLALPRVPHGELRDVAHDGRPGVQIFALQIAENWVHDAYLERGEQGGSLLDSVTTRVGYPEITGGSLLVYAPDAQERFPSGFGPDGRLFTADDPLVTLPRGYTVVRLSHPRFVFDRSRTARLDVSEIPFIAQADLSHESYVAAFDSLVAFLKQRYAYTAFRHIDWAARRAVYYARVVRAQLTHDSAAFMRAIVEFGYSLHDLHTGPSGPSALFRKAYAPQLARLSGFVGALFTALDDGRVVVSAVLPDSPAATAGIAPGDTVLAINGRPIAAVVGHAGLPTNYPRPEERALIRVAYAALFPTRARVSLTLRSDGGTPRTVTLTAVPLPTNGGGGSASTQAPIRTATMDGFGYAQWSEFSRPHATLALWEAFIRQMIAARTPGIILDLRGNRGGSGNLGALMASYLFTRSNGYLDRTIVSGYDPIARRVVTFPQSRQPLYALAPDLAYTGKVVVLVSQDCLSECEFFSYILKHSGRAAVVGQYATGGAGGSVNSLRLPDGITFTYTQSRAVDAHGVPIVEARGVSPTMRVPVTEETVQAQAQGRDPVLDAALAYLHRAR